MTKCANVDLLSEDDDANTVMLVPSLMNMKVAPEAHAQGNKRKQNENESGLALLTKNLYGY